MTICIQYDEHGNYVASKVMEPTDELPDGHTAVIVPVGHYWDGAAIVPAMPSIQVEPQS